MQWHPMYTGHMREQQVLRRGQRDAQHGATCVCRWRRLRRGLPPPLPVTSARRVRTTGTSGSWPPRARPLVPVCQNAGDKPGIEERPNATEHVEQLDEHGKRAQQQPVETQRHAPHWSHGGGCRGWRWTGDGSQLSSERTLLSAKRLAMCSRAARPDCAHATNCARGAPFNWIRGPVVLRSAESL